MSMARRYVAGLADPVWRSRAACRGTHWPEMFDLPERGSDNPMLGQAMALCRCCPVVAECFAWAKSDRAFEGLAGGHLWKKAERRGAGRVVEPC